MMADISDFVDISTVAERLGVKQQTVRMWRYRDILPPPDGYLNNGPVWEWKRIFKWANDTGRNPSR